jgi:S-adenosylmethionine:tRNA ribosyltransferase-isomerase
MKLPEFLNVNTFDYSLPESQIPIYPSEQRDASRLLYYHSGRIQHEPFLHLPKLLPAGAGLLFNKSKVVPARLIFYKDSGSKIEILLLQPMQSDYHHAFAATSHVVFQCMIGNKKRWREGTILRKNIEGVGVISAQWEQREENKVRLEWDGGIPFTEVLSIIGQLPLPPYLQREAEPGDMVTYQTVYAEEPGAVAAPTAGLHFTDRVMQELEQAGIHMHKMTLHVSAGTFLPVTEENVIHHPMHGEVFYFNAHDIHFIFDTPFLIPVGTTSLRMVESLWWLGVQLIQKGLESAPDATPLTLSKFEPFERCHFPVTKEQVKTALLSYLEFVGHETVSAETRLMVLPPYRPALCKGIITNFHQPSSTLVMLIAALIGDDWKKVYSEALDNGYRFLSYGDSSLLMWDKE